MDIIQLAELEETDPARSATRGEVAKEQNWVEIEQMHRQVQQDADACDR